ncbi:MAG: tetratricopeptide repeat protein [Planctomycetes bacterium]|nr:tetratricopeptide repeat protein [Planctomycetota bacterium]
MVSSDPRGADHDGSGHGLSHRGQAGAPPPPAGRPGFAAFLLLGLAVTLAYLPVLGAGFVNFDDNLFFGPDNPEFAREGLRALLDPTRTIANAYLPVSHLSLYLDYTLGGAAPRFAHLHSLVLHGLAAFLLARLLAGVGVRPWPATAGALLFAVHPALAESVAWVSGRKDVLSGVFALLCLGQVLRCARGGGALALCLACGTALLALYAKATAMVLPLLAAGLLLLEPRGGRRRFLVLLPLAVVTLCVTAHHAWLAAREGTLVPGSPLGRLTQVPGAYLHYLGTLVWPFSTNVLYPEARTLAAFRDAALPGGLVLVGVLGTALWLWRRPGRRPGALGVLLLLVALLPFNTAFPASAIAAADRYLYLGVPWLALAIVGLARDRAWPALACVILALPLAVVAHQRSREFSGSVPLWEASLRRDPDNAVARINLALALLPTDQRAARAHLEVAVAQSRHPVHRLRAHEVLRDLAAAGGRSEEAVAQARAAVLAADELVDLPATRARKVGVLLQAVTLLRAEAHEEEAAALLARAQALAPDHPQVLALAAATRLAAALGADGKAAAGDPRVREAEELLERALRVAPEAFEPNLVLGQLLAARGQGVSALARFRAAARAQPTRPESWLGMADVFLGQQLLAGAEQAIRDGVRAGAGDPALLARLGLALAGQGRLDEARDYYETYLQARPGDAAVRRSLAAVLAAQALPRLYQMDPERLEGLARRLRELDPENPKGLLVQGLAARHRRDYPAALVLLEQARERLAGDEEATRLLAETHRDQGYLLLLQAQRRDAAMEHFRRFLDLAVPGLPTESVRSVLQQEWRTCQERGVQAHLKDDLEGAEAAFRRCLRLLPEEPGPRLSLGLVLLARGAREEALAMFEAAERGQREHKLDATLPVLYQVLTLQSLGRDDEARRRGEGYLAEGLPGDGEALARLRAALRRGG